MLVLETHTRAPQARFHAAALVVVALALRVALILWLHSYEFPATRDHFAFGFETGSIARSLATGEGFSSPFGDHTGPTAWVAPVYPYLCAGVFQLFGIFTNSAGFVMLFLNSVFSALTCIPILLIGERTVGQRAGLWAAWAWAILPLFMRWPATWVWDMSLSALLLSLLFWFTLRLGEAPNRKRWPLFGVFWGVAALTNPALLSFLPFSLGWAAQRLRRQGKKCLSLVLLAVVACALVASPWLVRNWLVFERPVFLRSNFWFEFHLGNYHLSNGMGWQGKHPTVNPAEYEKYQRLGEMGYVEAARQEGLEFVRQYPGEFALLSLKRFLWFWNGESLLYARSPFELWRPWMILTFSVLAGLGLWVALRRRVNGATLFLFLLCFYPSVYYITYPNHRYRHALEPELLLLTIYLLTQLVDYSRARFSGSS